MFNLTVYKEVNSWKKPIHIARAFLAKYYRKLLPNLKIIGITGSVGKTLTQNAATAVLSQKYKVIAGDENLDPTFRIPQTVLSAKPWHQIAVLEYGVEHPGDMDYYLGIAKPEIAIITTITPTHTKYFKDVEGVFREKVKLVESLSKNDHVVLNADDPIVTKMSNYTQGKVIWYGQKARMGVKISGYKQSLKGFRFRISYEGQQAVVNWKVAGFHQLTSAYAAATIGIFYGLTIKQIAMGLSQTKPPEHRLNLIDTPKISILDDTYNSSPKAVQEAISTLVELGQGRLKIAVLGEMKDLGVKSAFYHKELGKQIAKTPIDYLLTVGDVAPRIGNSARQHQFKGEIYNSTNITDAIIKVKKVLKPKNLVLVKGSRHTHLERIVAGLLNKPTTIKCYHCGVLE